MNVLNKGMCQMNYIKLFPWVCSSCSVFYSATSKCVWNYRLQWLLYLKSEYLIGHQRGMYLKEVLYDKISLYHTYKYVRSKCSCYQKTCFPWAGYFFSNQHRYHIGIGLKIHVDDIFRNINFVVFPMGANGMVCHSKQVIWYIPSTVAFGQTWRWPSA